MYTVLNSLKNGDNIYYSVQDSSTGKMEFLTELELKLLTGLSLPLQAKNGTDVVLDENNNLICDTIDITTEVEAMSDDDYDEDYDDEYEESDDYEDEYDSEYTDIYEDEPDEDDYESDYTDIYEDEEEAEGSVVSALYELLSEEQIKVLKGYYMWFSQRLFTDAQKDPTFGLKDQNRINIKRSKLNTLRKDGQYRYAGFLDTGSVRAGYTCSLGHALRYMHVAWDITKGDIDMFFNSDSIFNYEALIHSNDCITFGIKCIGDFFEVDKECIDSLKKAQRESLKDMSSLYDYYTSGNPDEINKTFELMDSVIIPLYKSDVRKCMMDASYVPVIPVKESAFYNQFRSVGLIPPKTLIQEIRSCMMGWTNGRKYFNNKWAGYLRYPENSFKDRLNIILKLDYKDFCQSIDFREIRWGSVNTLKGAVTNYIYMLFAYQICGFYAYNADTNKDEGGKSKQIRALYYNHSSYNFSNTFLDFEYSLDYLKLLIDLYTLLTEYGAYSIWDKYVFKVFNLRKEDYITYDLNYSVLNDDVFEDINDKFPSYIDIIKSTISNLYHGTSYFITGRSGYIAMSNLVTIEDHKVSSLSKCMEELKLKIDDLNSKYNQINDYIQGINEERKVKLELDKQAKEKLEQQKEEVKNSIDTPRKVIEYLSDKDLSSYETSNLSLGVTITKQLAKSGKEPTDKQFRHIQRLYEDFSGVSYTGVGAVEVVSLSSRPDIQEAFSYINKHQELAEDAAKLTKYGTADKVLGIIQTISRYGTISPKQMTYVDAVLKVYSDNV